MQRPTLIAADSPASFLDDGPTSKLIRQILGAVSEFDKAVTVAKLKGTRDRVRRQRGKCEGRKSYGERDPDIAGKGAACIDMNTVRRPRNYNSKSSHAREARENGHDQMGRVASNASSSLSSAMVRSIMPRANSSIGRSVTR